MGTVAAVLILVILPLLLAWLLMTAPAEPDAVSRNSELANEIDDLLPQTQCGSCGYPGCLPYATAIVEGEADINQCPPGGERTVKLIARLLGREPIPLDPAYGATPPPQVAVIDEQACIGCVKCIRACPVDAIIGAPKQMHTVIPQECTGCGLCIEPCPVDCITMEPAEPPAAPWMWRRHHPVDQART